VNLGDETRTLVIPGPPDDLEDSGKYCVKVLLDDEGKQLFQPVAVAKAKDKDAGDSDRYVTRVPDEFNIRVNQTIELRGETTLRKVFPPVDRQAAAQPDCLERQLARHPTEARHVLAGVLTARLWRSHRTYRI